MSADMASTSSRMVVSSVTYSGGDWLAEARQIGHRAENGKRNAQPDRLTTEISTGR